ANGPYTPDSRVPSYKPWSQPGKCDRTILTFSLRPRQRRFWLSRVSSSLTTDPCKNSGSKSNQQARLFEDDRQQGHASTLLWPRGTCIQPHLEQHDKKIDLSSSRWHH